MWPNVILEALLNAHQRRRVLDGIVKSVGGWVKCVRAQIKEISSDAHHLHAVLITCYNTIYTSLQYLTIIELTMWLAGWPCVCGNRLLERLMSPSPSPKSQVMFASAFS